MNADPHHPLTVDVGAATFESEVLRSTQPALVAFCAPWSRPCQILKSALDEVATSCAGNVKVCQVNADDNPDLSIWYEVQSVPTLLYFIHGRLCAKVVGTLTRDAILARLKLVLQHNQATLSGANPGAAK